MTIGNYILIVALIPFSREEDIGDKNPLVDMYGFFISVYRTYQYNYSEKQDGDIILCWHLVIR